MRCRLGQEETLAVYKPAAGERPLWDFEGGTLHRREAAAYEVARLLGWDLVPLTVVRLAAPLGEGSLQRFVDHDPTHHYFNLRADHERALRRLALFDIVCNNADRKSGHCLLGADGRVWAIDNGLTFHAEPKLRTVIWDWAGEPIDPADAAAVGGLGRTLGDGGRGRARLLRLISAEELAALLRRAARWSKAASFPEPDSSWSFPWPLV